MSRTNRCKYEIIGEIMTSDEKEVDEKLYRVVRKKRKSCEYKSKFSFYGSK